jgi:hypothetical protein
MRASANVIHPRSFSGNADKERASVASVVPSSFMASGGAATSAPNSHLMKLIIPILVDDDSNSRAEGVQLQTSFSNRSPW